MTRQATDQLYVELEYYYPEEYVVYIAEAVAACSSQVTFACEATKIAGGQIEEASGNLSLEATLASTPSRIRDESASLTVVASTTATISHIEGADLFAFTNAQLAAQGVVIRNGNIAATSAFSTAIDAVRGIYVSAQADSIATVISMGSRSRAAEAAVVAAFSLATSAERLRDFNIIGASLSQSTLIVNAVKSIDANAVLISQATVIANTGEIQTASASLSAQATLFASRNFGTGRPVELTSSSTSFSTTSKFGSHSLAIPGGTSTANIIFTNDNFNLEIPANTDFIFEFWFNLNGQSVLGSNDYFLCGVGDATSLVGMNSNDTWAVGFGGPTGFPRTRLRFKFATAFNTFTTIETTEGAYTSGSSTWNHIVIKRRGSTITVENTTTGVSGSGTYSGAIYSGSYKKFRFENGFAYPSGTPDLLIDDLSLRIGGTAPSSGGFGESSQIANDPDTQIFLYHFNNDLLDDVNATFNQAAALSSTATLLGSISGPVKANASLTAIATLTAIGSKTTEINLMAFSNASVTVPGERIRFANSNQSSEFTESVETNVVRSAISAISSQASLTADNTRIRDAAIATDAIFSELAAVAKIGDFLVTLESAFTQTAVAVKTADINSSQSATSALAVDAIKAVNADAALSSSASLSVDGLRIRFGLTSAQAEFSQSTQAVKTASANSSANSEFSVVAETSGIANAVISAAVVFNQTAQGQRIRFADSQLTVVANLNITVDKFAGASSALNVQAALSTPGERIVPAAIQTDAIFSELVAIAKTGQGFISLDVPASLVAGASVITENVILANSSANLTTIAVKTAQFNSTLSAIVSSSIEGTTNITAEADLSSNFALTADADRNASAISLVASAGSLTATVGQIKPFAANLAVQGFELVIGDKTAGVTANLTGQTALTANIGYLANINANLVANGGLLTVGNIIHITPYLTWKISAEDRNYLIRQEDRDYAIKQENRTYRIKN